MGDNCFIGFGATILPNVKIGDNSIIAAGSMVTKNVPAGEVWGGPGSFHYENGRLCQEVL